MTLYTHGPVIAWDPVGQQLIKSAIGNVYAPTDPGFATPLTVTNLFGVSITDLISDSDGVIPPFQSTLPRVVWKAAGDDRSVSMLSPDVFDAAVAAQAPTGTPVANQLPYRNDSNQFTWTAATAVVARALGWKIATDPVYGADPTAAVDATAALQACLTDAAAANTTAYLAGTFKTSGTLTVTSSVDAHLSTINYSASSAAAWQVGDPASTLMRQTISLGVVIATAKTTTGWAQVIGSVGMRISNCYSCFIQFSRISNFETGLLGHGQTPNGTAYCEIRLGHVDNCKVSIGITPQDSGTTTTSGWFNQNLFIGGRLSHNSSEGSQVSGTRNILISTCSNIVNNNTWLNTSIETPDVVEYHIECFGQYNYFDRCRFENSGGNAHRRVYWRAASKGNIINGGFSAGLITEVTEAGAINDIRSDVFNRFSGGSATKPAVWLENVVSSTDPAFVITGAGGVAAGADPSTAYAVSASAQLWRGKRPTDSFDRLQMDYLNGRMYVGDATAAPTGYIGGSPSLVYVGGGLPLGPLVTNTQDLGLSTLKWRYVRAGTAVQTGAVATGSRPAASTAGAGAMIFDSTLNKPVWSDGTNWRDATGTIA